MTREQLIIGGAALLVGLALIKGKAAASSDSIEAIRADFAGTRDYQDHLQQLADQGAKCECADPKPGVYVPCDCSTPGAMVAEGGASSGY